MGDLWATYGRPMGDLWATYGIDREMVGSMMRHFRDILRYFEGELKEKYMFCLYNWRFGCTFAAELEEQGYRA